MPIANFIAGYQQALDERARYEHLAMQQAQLNEQRRQFEAQLAFNQQQAATGNAQFDRQMEMRQTEANFQRNRLNDAALRDSQRMGIEQGQFGLQQQQFGLQQQQFQQGVEQNKRDVGRYRDESRRKDIDLKGRAVEREQGLRESDANIRQSDAQARYYSAQADMYPEVQRSVIAENQAQASRGTGAMTEYQRAQMMLQNIDAQLGQLYRANATTKPQTTHDRKLIERNAAEIDQLERARQNIMATLGMGTGVDEAQMIQDAIRALDEP